MTKYWLAGIATFAFVAGPALAQGIPADITNSQTTTTTTVQPAPPVGAYSTSRTEKVLDSNGVETQKSQSYVSGAYGTRAVSNSETVAPDGSVVNATHEDRSVLPTGQSVTTTRSVSTTTSDGDQ